MSKGDSKSDFDRGAEQADVQRAADAGLKDGENNKWKPDSADTEAQQGAYSRNWKAGYDRRK